MTRFQNSVVATLAIVLTVGGVWLARSIAWHQSGARYTCADIYGPNPRPGYVAILPPGYIVGVTISINGAPAVEDLRVWDEHQRLVCDATGKDVPRSGQRESTEPPPKSSAPTDSTAAAHKL